MAFFLVSVMDDDIKSKGVALAERITSLSDEEKELVRRSQIEEANAEFSAFVNAFDEGKCYICAKPLKTYSSSSPCLHWFLRPKGIKKKHFDPVFEKYGFFQIQTYLRWIASHDGVLKNINDMPQEGTGKKFEVTIKYRDIDWSFSCAHSDYSGHKNSMNGNFPHYHFQMRRDSKPFIRFNDFHIPFGEKELVQIEAMDASEGKIIPVFINGNGMSDVFNDEMLETVLSQSFSVDDESEGMFHSSTIIMAEEGKRISGEDMDALFREAKEKGVTVASLVHKLPNAVSRTMVTPGDAVVEQATRKGGRSSK